MPDWLVKILSSIVSVKTAAIALFTCVGLVLSWSSGSSLIKSMGIPENISIWILVVMLYSFSHVLVEWIIKFSNGLGILREWIRQIADDRKRQNNFRELAGRTIPLLSKSEIDLMTSLLERDQVFDVREKSVNHLEKQKFIKRIYKASNGMCLFEIDEIVKAMLISHLSQQRKTTLDNFVENMTKDQRHFLELFFAKIVSEGTRESGVKMKLNVFKTGVSMSSKELLDHCSRTSEETSKESFKLRTDVSELLQNRVFHQRPVRTELNLDSDFIIASYASGAPKPGRGSS